jgi:hypothetical protein
MQKRRKKKKKKKNPKRKPRMKKRNKKSLQSLGMNISNLKKFNQNFCNYKNACGSSFGPNLGLHYEPWPLWAHGL